MAATLSLSVDGVPLSSVAFDIESAASRRSLGGARLSDVVMPGSHGVNPGIMVHDTRDLAISMWVIGVDSNGNVPKDGSQLALYEANLDHLLALFGRRHRLLDLTMTMGDGSKRITRARVVSSFAPKEELAGSIPLGQFTVVFELVDVFWQSGTDALFSLTYPKNGTWWLDEFYGSTAPIEDAVITFTGPVTNPGLTDPATGDYFEWTGSLTESDQLVIDCKNWTVKKNGSSVISTFKHSRPDGKFHVLHPEYNSSLGKWGPRITTRGSGMGAGTIIDVRGRKKYL